jgi:hypothetical protein
MAITLSSAATSYRDWKTQFQFTDGDPTSPTFGQLLDFTGAYIAIAVEDDNGCQRIFADTINGKVTILSLGTIELDILASDMNLCAGAYPMGGFYQLNGETIDLFEGTLSIRKGIPKP